MSLFAVLANRFDGATFHRFAALFFFFRTLGLFVDERIAFVIGTSEVFRCCLTAQIAVNALTVHIELPCYVFLISIFFVSHIGDVVQETHRLKSTILQPVFLFFSFPRQFSFL